MLPEGFVQCWVNVQKIRIFASDITFVIFRFLIFNSHLGYLVGPNMESSLDTNIKLGLVLVLGFRC
jgi:hypothetical protein